MITVIIPYEGNKVLFSQLLVSIQPQLHPDDDIYIVDTTKNQEGVKLAKLLGSTRSFIFVEVAPEKSEIEALKYGFQNMKENKQEGALILPADCVISSTLVANFKKAKKTQYDMLFCRCSVVDQMASNFKWFDPPPVVEGVTPVRLVQIVSAEGPCYISSRVITEDYELKVTDPKRVGYIDNEQAVKLRVTI